LKSKQMALLATILILLGGVSYVIYSLSWVNKQPSNGTNASLDAASIIKAAVLYGGTIYLEDKDINSLLKIYSDNLQKQGNIKIEDISCHMIGDKIDLYINLKYTRFMLQLNTKGSLGYESDAINYTPDYFKLGKFTLPKKCILAKLGSRIPVNAEKERIEVNKAFIPVLIEELGLKDNKLEIRFRTPLLKNSKASTPSKPKEPADAAKPNSSPDTADQNNSSNTVKPNNFANTPKSDIGSSTAGKSQEQAVNEATPVLIRVNDQLKKVYSLVKTSNEKQLIAVIQGTISKLLQNPGYSYERDAANVKEKYSKLSKDEREDLQTAILRNMDVAAIIQLKEYFGL
jgi:hypothetical protein